MKVLVKEAVQAFFEERWIHALERTVQTTDARRGYHTGYYQYNLITPIGTIELRVLRDREGRFSTELFELYLQSEKALVLVLAEMYIQGVSRRKVAHIKNSS